MKKNLLVATACALGAIALSSCGGSNVLSEFSIASTFDNATEPTSVNVVLNRKDNKNTIAADLKNIFSAKATTVEFKLTGFKSPSVSKDEKTFYVEDTAGKKHETGVVYLLDSDITKNKNAVGTNVFAKYFAVSTGSVDYTNDSTDFDFFKYNTNKLYHKLSIDIGAMKTAFKALDGCSDLTDFTCTLTLHKAKNGLVSLAEYTNIVF